MNAIPKPPKPSHGPPSGKQPDPIDVHIGKRIRLRRTSIGVTLEELAAGVGVAFQQIQKYENAVNRINTARLCAIAAALRCPAAFFYQGFDPATAGADIWDPQGKSAPIIVGAEQRGVPSTYETRKLMRAYYGIKDSRTRQKIVALAVSLAKVPARSV